MNGDHLADIRSLGREEIERFFLEHQCRSFRAGQVYEWLWKRGCHSFNEMTNLSKSTRQLLSDHFSFHTAIPDKTMKSHDGTIKMGFILHDGSMVEGVLIPSEERTTACISSQVGCALGCKFCATGHLGFTRNLTAGEIFDQVVHLTSLAAKGTSGLIDRSSDDPSQLFLSPENHLSNIVYMGMGEPFLNYEEIVASMEKITSEEGLGMSPQRITISSIGIPKMIRKMADDKPQYHFALSLHAALDQKRDQIIPFNIRHPLREIVSALKYYYSVTGKRFTIEYILFRNFNDSLADAKALALFCRNFPVKINLIEYNQVHDSGFTGADPQKIKSFIQFLSSKNLVVNLRKSRGNDIDAACGQLALKNGGKNNEVRM